MGVQEEEKKFGKISKGWRKQNQFLLRNMACQAFDNQRVCILT